MRRLAWTLALATALVPRQRAPRRRRTARAANIFEQAGQAASKFFEERARQDSLALAKFTEGLEKSRMNFLSDLRGIFDSKGATLDETLEKLEDALLSADIGATTTDQILEDVKAVAQESGEYEEQDVTAILRGRMAAALDTGGPAALTSAEQGPTVILVLGANGMGKTTTIGKLASRLRRETGQKVLLAACDTFRAAAVEQLQEWARRAEVDIVVPDAGIESPAAAAYKACDACLAGDYDVLIVDTSGRLVNNVALTKELDKIRRTLEKKIPGAPHESLLVVDAAVGRNALDQARGWQKDVGVTGLAVTKLDGTARAGFVVSVVQDLGIPVKLVGVGETLDDLRDFEGDKFVDALLDVSDADDLRARFAKISAERAAMPRTVSAPAAAARPASPSKKKRKGKKKSR
jgi:fused signal recognition particle receptor